MRAIALQASCLRHKHRHKHWHKHRHKTLISSPLLGSLSPHLSSSLLVSTLLLSLACRRGLRHKPRHGPMHGLQHTLIDARGAASEIVPITRFASIAFLPLINYLQPGAPLLAVANALLSPLVVHGETPASPCLPSTPPPRRAADARASLAALRATLSLLPSACSACPPGHLRLIYQGSYLKGSSL